MLNPIFELFFFRKNQLQYHHFLLLLLTRGLKQLSAVQKKLKIENLAKNGMLKPFAYVYLEIVAIHYGKGCLVLSLLKTLRAENVFEYGYI